MITPNRPKTIPKISAILRPSVLAAGGGDAESEGGSELLGELADGEAMLPETRVFEEEMLVGTVLALAVVDVLLEKEVDEVVLVVAIVGMVGGEVDDDWGMPSSTKQPDAEINLRSYSQHDVPTVGRSREQVVVTLPTAARGLENPRPQPHQTPVPQYRMLPFGNIHGGGNLSSGTLSLRGIHTCGDLIRCRRFGRRRRTHDRVSLRSAIVRQRINTLLCICLGLVTAAYRQYAFSGILLGLVKCIGTTDALVGIAAKMFSHTIGVGGDHKGCVVNETIAGTFSQIGEAWSFGEVDGIARLGDSEGTTIH
jgi:hypothetical protein